MKTVWKNIACVKWIPTVVFGVLITVVFTCWPVSPAPLHIRIYFDEIVGNECSLYYTTDTANGYSEERHIISSIEDGKQVDFRLDASLAGHIRELRIDWPDQEQLLCVKSVTLSSAGVVQKEFNPCDFFSDIVFQNDIADRVMVWARDRTYILTGGEDPYMVLGEDMVNQIQKCHSSYTLTRLAVCFFFFCCIYFGKRKLFASSEEII